MTNSAQSSFSDPEPRASPRKPQITGKGLGIAAGLWLLYTLLVATILTQTENLPFVRAFIGQCFESGILALGSLPVWWIVIRYMDDLHWDRVLAVHLVLGPLYAWSTLEGYIGVTALGPQGDLVASALRERYGWLLLSHFTMYIIQFLIYHTVRSVQRLRLKEQQAADLLARARKQELAALKSQINPHFLFNTLNSVSATLKRDPDQAREMIAKLAEMMRYALASSNRNLVPLRDEIDFARRYLDLESHRFSDRLQVRVHVDLDDEELDTPVPPMVLQPLIENALRHGIAPCEDGGTVRVLVGTENGHVHVRVEDTGVGPDIEDPLDSATEGVGLANTSTRLQHAFGPDAALRTARNEPQGFVVSFSVPTR